MSINTTKIAFVGAAALAITSLFNSQLFAYGDTPPPQWSEGTPCFTEFHVVPGQQLCFNVSAFDFNGAALLLQWNDVPFNATTNPPAPLAGNGSVSTQFCWTAGPQDIGMNFLVIFTASYISTAPLPDAKCDITIIVDPDLSATVTSFTGGAAFIGGPIKINWETSSEIDNAYFNIYRSETTFGNAIKVNQSPIMATGGPAMPASYSQIDRRVTNGARYGYWLESIDIYGESQLFGPIFVVAR
ncbi:MAG: hypothetical protein HY286_11705 [Planctomycetes bacterium]|nr:hypothetical protein [Planctomycetota bacterium]